MNVVILGVLSTKFAAAVGTFLSGFTLLLLALLLLRRRTHARLRPLFVEKTIRPSVRMGLAERTNTRGLDMASRAPPPRVLERQWMSDPSRRPRATLRS
jgi:hypothetical protein